MRLVGRDENQLTFDLGDQQKLLLERILKEYPVAGDSLHPISKSGESVELPDQQELLAEALAENRAEMKRRIGNFLRDPRRFERTETGWRITILSRQLNWLLQVLNEIRIGSWRQLDCPEPDDLTLALENPEPFFRMELSGQFQHVLLCALNGDLEP